MKIAVLTNDYPPDTLGGAGIVAETQVRGLEARGHVVKVCVPRLSFRERSIIERLFFHVRDLGQRREYVDEIVAWKPEVLLTHNLTGCGMATPRMIESKLRIPWIHMLHDVQLFEPSGQIVTGESWSALRQLWRRLWALLRRYSLGRPTQVISPTQWLLDLHRRYGFFYTIPSTVIPNPLPMVLIADSAGEKVKQGILYVGRLDWDKGVDVLIEAWKMFAKPRSSLTLVGEGSLKAKLEQMSEPGLCILGSQLHEQVLQEMCKHRVLVVPSRVWENQPTVILEGLATGCQIIASDVGGIPETLGEAGWIVPAGNASILAKTLQQALEPIDMTPREETCQAILKRHGRESVLAALEDVLRSNL